MRQTLGGSGWQGDLLDLDAYLGRIGYEGDRSPTLAALRGLQRAHVTSLPFENLEIYLGRPIVLGVEALQNKIVRHRRGGYCFEHTELFAAALERFGFSFNALSARVQLGSGELRSATHALVRVEADGGVWICDVGFGSGPLEPLEFRDGAESEQGGWAYRLERLTASLDGLPGVEHWAMHQRGPDGWLLRHVFMLAPSYHVDYELANHYVSTNPRSPFTGRAYAQRFAPDVHYQLDGTRLTSNHAAGPVETRDVEPGEVPKILAEVFGIELDADDTARLVAGLSEA
jgi:N-hydroxyarylamine O-acetyltransferase